MSDKPLWRSIRGVGLPQTNEPTWTRVTIASIPNPDYSHIDYQGAPEPYLAVSIPLCRRCGLAAEAETRPNRWWCHYCWEEVRAPMKPAAMIPERVIEGAHLEPSITDPKGQMICPKCATTRRPRVDNQGYDCLCGEVWNIPGVPRASPTTGF